MRYREFGGLLILLASDDDDDDDEEEEENQGAGMPVCLGVPFVVVWAFPELVFFLVVHNVLR